MQIELVAVVKFFHFKNLQKNKTMNKYTEDDLREELKTKEYEYGFYTDIESDTFPNGLNEDIVRAISLKKEEPQWMTEWRFEAFELEANDGTRMGKCSL